MPLYQFIKHGVPCKVRQGVLFCGGGPLLGFGGVFQQCLQPGADGVRRGVGQKKRALAGQQLLGAGGGGA